jgi:release factor glutamine methyltransferase
MTGWTVDQVLTASTLHLAAANVTEPDLSVQHLLADSLQLGWESGFRDVLNQRSTVLTAEQASDFHAKLDRRSNHEPLQYILGQWDFLDYTISIKSPLLCPRPETEELVQHIVIGHETTKAPPIHILDVGCGTGVIGLALAKQLFPNALVQAIDIDPVAIETSRENAQRILGEKGLSSSSSSSCYHYQATLCSAQDYRPDHPFDIVVSNPPYIPRADMDALSLDVIGYENDAALCGGEDGMDVIRIIVHQLRHWCNSGAVCWMEVDPTHPRLIDEWLSQESEMLGVAFEAAYHDMFGKDRFVKLRVL